MNRRNTQDYQMLTRVVDFGTNNVGLFPKTTVAPELLSSLETAVTNLSHQASARITAEAAIRTNRRLRGAARETLKSLLEKSEQTGTVLKSDKFRVPLKRNDQAWIVSGRAFAQAAEPLKKEFAKHGLPQFTDVMNAAVENLERTILDYSQSKAMHAIAVREFEKSMKEAMDDLHGLDALVANTLSDNAVTMASWTLARSVVRTSRRRAAPKPPDPPMPPVPPAPPDPVPVPIPVVPTSVAA